jgi:uncharacterized RDD family membrane protein YckC
VPLDSTEARTPALWRQLAAILYDALLIFAILVLGAAVVVIPLGMLGHELAPGDPWFRLYLLALIVGFYSYFWTRGGQTLGMRAWRIRLVTADGDTVGLGDALRRLLAATLSWGACGLGFLWVLIDRAGLSWHDRLSSTRLVLLEKRK